MKISVIMIDGGFRDNAFSAKYFAEQDFPAEDYEIIWVEYFNKVNLELDKSDTLQKITLNREDEYHSSFCFNAGIEMAKGELLVIPDADQIAKPDFLKTVWHCHQQYDKLVMYIYRFDETTDNRVKSFDFDELEKKCVLKNPENYGGCITARRKWFMEVNGYEMHPIMQSGFHANGMDMAVRFKNLGLAIQWHPTLKLFHPYHPMTLSDAWQYRVQHKLIRWRKNNRIYRPLEGIDSEKNTLAPDTLIRQLEKELQEGKSSGNRLKKYLTSVFHLFRGKY